MSDYIDLGELLFKYFKNIGKGAVIIVFQDQSSTCCNLITILLSPKYGNFLFSIIL